MGLFNKTKKKKVPEPPPTPWEVKQIGGQWVRINTKTGESLFLEDTFQRLLRTIKKEKLSTTKAKKLFKDSNIVLSKREVNEVIKPITKKHRRH